MFFSLFVPSEGAIDRKVFLNRCPEKKTEKHVIPNLQYLQCIFLEGEWLAQNHHQKKIGSCGFCCMFPMPERDFCWAANSHKKKHMRFIREFLGG